MSHPAFPVPTRRAIVLSLAGGAVASGLLTVSGSHKRRESRTVATSSYGKTSPMAEASFEQWSAKVGSLFFASTEAGAVALRLISVTGLPVVGHRPSALRQQPFQAQFKPEGTMRRPAGERLYRVRLPGHGTFHLYFSGGEALTALFN